MEHVELGYAQTGHAAQGRTVDYSLLLVDGPLEDRAGFVLQGYAADARTIRKLDIPGRPVLEDDLQAADRSLQAARGRFRAADRGWRAAVDDVADTRRWLADHELEEILNRDRAAGAESDRDHHARNAPTPTAQALLGPDREHRPPTAPSSASTCKRACANAGSPRDITLCEPAPS